MINYRVEDLEWLVERLKEEGVTALDKIESYGYGKLVHILNPDGNKNELWEPMDDIFDLGVVGRTKLPGVLYFIEKKQSLVVNSKITIL